MNTSIETFGNLINQVSRRISEFKFLSCFIYFSDSTSAKVKGTAHLNSGCQKRFTWHHVGINLRDLLWGECVEVVSVGSQSAKASVFNASQF